MACGTQYEHIPPPMAGCYSRRHNNFEGYIVIDNGMVWPIPDVDNVLGDPRWFSYYFEEVEGEPRREVRLIERLRLIDLYFKIKHPNIARHFDK